MPAAIGIRADLKGGDEIIVIHDCCLVVARLVEVILRAMRVVRLEEPAGHLDEHEEADQQGQC